MEIYKDEHVHCGCENLVIICNCGFDCEIITDRRDEIQFCPRCGNELKWSDLS